MSRASTHGGDPPAEDASDPLPSAGASPLRSGASPPARPDTWLVLSEDGAGGVTVRWHVAPRDLQHVRGLFPRGVDPVPVIRLIHLTEPGQAEAVARASLGDAQLSSDGEVSFDLSGGGLSVEAELGLETPAGGWLLLVRSNPLVVVTDVIPVSPDVVTPELGLVHAEPALSATGADLIPVFPEIGVGAAPWKLASAGRPPVPSSAVGSAVVAAAGQEAWGPVSVADRSDSGAVPADRYADGDVAGPDSALVEDGLVHDRQADAVLAVGAASTAARVGTASPAERSRSSSYGTNEPRYGATGDSGLEVYTQLLVHGRAQPGSEIDLFGHPIQIGSGGRFSFHLPVSNSELLKQALDEGLPLAALGRPDS